MQLVYLDEAGISNRAHEPFLVVAGVIIDADNKWKAIEAHFHELARRYVPDQPEGNFIFHAKDIWHGNKIYDRATWGNKRWELLEELAAVPAKFSLPIVAGFIERETAYRYYKQTVAGVDEHRIHSWTYMEAFHRCVRRVENWMQKNCAFANEIAVLIVEDTDRVKGAVKMVHSAYTDRSLGPLQGAFQSHHIADAVHFTEKNDAPLLQIADHCAFIIKRHLMKRKDTEPLFEAIQPQLFLQPTKDEGILVSVPIEHVKIIQ